MGYQPTSPLRVLGFAGSLRAGSYNRSLLEAAADLAPEGMEIEVFDIRGVPLYDADLDNDEGRPKRVRDLKEEIARADALLVASPEYNYGVSGVTKNVIDWASRPGFRSPLAGKPAGVMSASPGASGGMRGQEQLKLNLAATLALVMPHPGVAVSKAREKFDSEGRLTDETTRDFLSGYLEQFEGWVRRVSAPAGTTA